MEQTAGEPNTLKPKPEDHVSTESSTPYGSTVPALEEHEEDEDIEFEDVEIPSPTVQTTYLSTEDETEEEEEDIQFEDVDIDALASKQEKPDEGTGTLQLNLTAARDSLTPSKRNRKTPLSKAEKNRRIEIHQFHLLCLLAHVEKRNNWCNDPIVHEALRPLLPAKTIQFLTPGSHLTQFGQTESLKRGLQQAEEIFQERFRTTEVGLRRALWAEDKADLKDWETPRNIDNCLDKADFRRASLALRGSRDVGAMLFCALLRAVGLEVRLVCSLQPLTFAPGGPTLPRPRHTQKPSKTTPTPAVIHPAQDSPSPYRPSRLGRLGHPHATAYHIPRISPPPSSSSRPPTHHTGINESEYPVYWAEILDVGHQKWQPVDALVTGTHFRPQKLEPPASDRGNALTYVVAFEEDGAAKDVTRRYAKAYNSKTIRMRIDGPLVPAAVKGPKWWRKALRRYKSRGPPSDLDQIEDNELNAAEAREPMPRNVADFKDHPIYALERHLRRHEVLVPGAEVVGTVGAGSKGALEKIYRRKDLRLARSADKWYRMGREVKSGEEPIKVVRKRKPAKRKARWHLHDSSDQSSDDDDPVLGPDPAKGTPLFMFDQTDLYVPPPVVGGRIPKNKFGNLDVYVSSMVPAGGVHIRHPRAGHAAHILGVDYAPALQGFDFKGRKGTAVYNGVIVPVEALEAVDAVLKGFVDLEAQLEEERRSRRALETWKKWLRTLRIRRRLFEGDEYWGDTELGEVGMPSEVESEIDEDGEEPHRPVRRRQVVLDDDNDDEGGGFEPGGFEAGGFEPGGFEPGGFEPGGFEPGGFEPGGFEPGGFESGGDLEAVSQGKGKGKEPEPLLYNHEAEDQVRPAPGGLDGVDEQSTQLPGGLEISADVDMQDLPSLPVDAPPTPKSMATAATKGLTPNDPLAEKIDDSIDAPGGRGPSRLDSARSPSSDPKLGETMVSNSDSAEPRVSQEASENAELDDAASDVTEEMFMDEDGSLLE